jgi:hypothetical protein
MMIEVDDIEINVIRKGGEDYFSLTNMIKARLSNLRVADWLRTKETMEMLVAWEYLNNKNFNYGEFAAIRNWMKKPGSRYFKLGVKDWIERTRAIGLIASPGRYGGTYSHRDIAVEFAGWISPLFRQELIDVIGSHTYEGSKASQQKTHK